MVGWIIEDLNIKIYWKQSSIYVLASEKENASIALLEAMSAGCAVITTNVSGCPETVGDTGLLVEIRNYQDLKEKIELLISDNIKMSELERKARERILGKYDWNIVLNEYIKNL